MRVRTQLVLAIAIALAPGLAAQDAVTVTARVDNPDVYVGQSFLFQIDVDGSDAPNTPDLSSLGDAFQVQDAGGGSRNSQSISIVNGSLSRQVQRGYTFRYQLVPKRQGTLTIPSLTISVAGKTLKTEPIQIQVKPPEEVSDFKLRSSLSATKAYVGQPLLLTTTWYVGRNVDQVSFNMPLLEDDRFEITDLPSDPPRQADDLLEIAVNNHRVTARRSRGTLDGREFLTVSFVKVLIPKQPGRYELPSSVASFRAVNTVRQSPRGFSDLFGSAFFSRLLYEDFAVPSNTEVLEVSQLPLTGRPANFSGLVGSFDISAAAEPTNVSLGDPIKLQIALSGPEYLDYVRLPHLSTTPGMRQAFNIPQERPQGEMRGAVKVFAQSIRPKSVDVKEIPPIELNYFDPETGAYDVAKTDPIPISVSETRLLTSADLGDLGPAPEEQQEEPATLAPNDESVAALTARRPGVLGFLSLGWLLAFASPPAAFLALIGFQKARIRTAGPVVNVEAKKALEQLRTSSNAAPENVARLLREYLGAKLGLSAPALTFADVAGPLQAAGASDELLSLAASAFRSCDEARFARSAAAPGLEALAVQACERVESLEALP